jgi:AraC family transcriptional activator of pobA
VSSSGLPPARRPAIKAYLQLIAVTIARLLGKDRNRAISSARDVQTVIRSRELVEQRYRDHPSLDYWRGERYIHGARTGFLSKPR